MMAIDSINNSAVTQLLYPTLPSITGSGSDTDSGTGSSSVGAVGSSGSRFANAISQALTQIGVTPTTTSSASTSDTSSSTTQDPTQAAQAFASALFAALHAQNSSNGASASGGGSDGVPKVGGHHGGGGGKMEGGLQQLIQNLNSGTTSSDTSGTSGTSDANSTLQTAFDNLVAANGGTTGSASLSAFLQNLSQDMQGAPSSGNVVSTSA
jgi:hypothetical protein